MLCALAGGSLYADASYAARRALPGRLSGSVVVCSSPAAKRCASAAATVSVREVRDGRAGRVVAKQYASGGRFSFSLSAGTYEPQASAVHARLNGGRCSSTVAEVRAGKSTQETIRCYVK